MTRIYWIRHGITASNKNRIMQGRLDTDLSEEGLRQAEYLAERLKNMPLKRIYCSSLKRTRQTAECLQRFHPQLNIVSDIRLSEIDSGLMEGLAYDEIAERWPEQWHILFNEMALYSPPEGETTREVFDRAYAALQDILAENPEGEVAVVTHGFLLATLVNHFRGRSFESIEHEIYENCSLTTVDYRSLTDFTVCGLNDCSHFPD